MRKSAALLAVALLAAASTLPSAAAPPAPSLAKTKLAEANATAKEWKPDAVLIQVAARDVGQDGMQMFWDYGFYSAAAKTCLVVNAAGSETHSVESGGPGCESAAVGEFMDSDRAQEIARKNGIKKPKTSMVVNLSLDPKGDRTVWSIMDGSGMERGDVILDLDASTGQVVSKITQQ